MSKKRGRTKKEKNDFDTTEGVLNFIEKDLFGVRKRARAVSAGATGGALPQLDDTIRSMDAKVGAIKVKPAPDSIIRTINETAQTVKNNRNSISALEQSMQDLTSQSNKTMGMLGELMNKFNTYKKNTDEKFKEFEKLSNSSSKGGGVLGSILSSASNLKNTASAAKPSISATKSSLFKSVGSLGKLAGGRIPLIGGIIEGLTEYVQGGELGKSLAIGAGNILGGIIGGALGTMLTPGVGTALGGITGSLVGGDLASKGYQWLFGSNTPRESQAVKQARQEQEKVKNAVKQDSAPETNLFDRVGKFFGLTPKDNEQYTPPVGKGVGETGSSTEAIGFFVDKGWTREQAAGIVGNLQAESGPDMKTNAVGDGGKAYGIAQWHPDRQGQFKQVYGKDIREAGFREQLEFIHWELNNTERRAGEALRAAKSAMEAANIFNRLYERSADTGGRRAANAAALMSTTTADATNTAQPNQQIPASPDLRTQEQSVTPGAPGVIPGARPTASSITTNITPNINSDGQQNVTVAATPPPEAITSNINASATKPQNVTVESNRVNLSGVNPDLLSKFYALAKEYGKPVQIASAQRDNNYQAELWARGKLGEPGIYMPALPQQAQRVTIQNGPFAGRTVDVPGGGQGSSHSDGRAIDTPATRDPMFRSLMPKFGLTIPFGESDPVHVQKIGDSVSSGGGGSQIRNIPQGSYGSGQYGGYASQTIPSRRPSISPPLGTSIGMIPQIGMGRSTTGFGAQSIPDIITRTQPSGIVPYGPQAMTPDVGALVGIINALAAGGTRSMQQFPVSAISGLLSNILTPNQRATNPTFYPDGFEDNNVPPALPPQNITRELFGMDIFGGYYP